MARTPFARCFCTAKAVGEAESSSTAPISTAVDANKLQLGQVQLWTPREVQTWLQSVGAGKHASNFDGVQGQELLELTHDDVASRVQSKKAAAQLSKDVQHLQSTWLQVTPTGPQPMSSEEVGGTQVTILRGAAAGVINVPIETAEPSDTIKAVWTPEIMEAGSTAAESPQKTQFEKNASVPIPTALQAEVAAERAMTEALAKDMSWYQTVIDNPLAGSKSVGGSTNTSPGGPTQSGSSLRQAILARSASQALAAKAAASALKVQINTQSSLDDGPSLTPKPSAALTPRESLQLTPVSAMTPGHATHTYTPGSYVHSPTISRDVEEPGAEDLEVARVTLHCSPPLAEDLGVTEAAVVQPAAVMPDPRPKSASQRLDYADYVENAEDEVLSQNQQHTMAAEPAEQSTQQELQGAESLEPPSPSHAFSQVAENEGSTQQVYSQAVKTSELPAMAQEQPAVAQEQPAVAQEQPAVAQDLEPEATFSAQRPSEQGGWFSRSILLPQQQSLRTAKAEELAQHKDVDLEVQNGPLAQVKPVSPYSKERSRWQLPGLSRKEPLQTQPVERNVHDESDLSQATAVSSYSKEERWQLPGLTGQDAFQPEEWHNFRTKVGDTVPQATQEPETQMALRDSSNFGTGEEAALLPDDAAAQQAYVQSLVKRFEKSVGPSWPSRAGFRHSIEKENADQAHAVQSEAKYLVFTPAGQAATDLAQEPAVQRA